jgi:S-adenosylmethionine:tRNA ribosyltransferase-isomerase
MRLSDFDFDLPPERIALRPQKPRDAARLLVARGAGVFEDLLVCDLPNLLDPGDVLVFNDTKVISARLAGRRLRGALSVEIEATLLRRQGPGLFTALMRPGKRLKPKDIVLFGPPGAEPLEAEVLEKDEDGVVTLAFALEGSALDQAIERVGAMPLPPYIASRRAEDAADALDYQTVYARAPGSVAAPTAGLHFTEPLLKALQDKGVGQVFVTLHVGAGTFLPVKTEDLGLHRMHAESGEVSPAAADALNQARARGGRIVCVGTTSLRLLESAAAPDGILRPFAGETSLFITPPFAFRAADGLFTNFHLPRSTLLMLVAALSGLEEVKAGYAHALERGYRFYSYGDASLWFRGGGA